MQHRTLRRCAATAAILALAASAVPAFAAPGRRARAVAATRYVADNQTDTGAITGGFSQFGTTADAVVAFVAARRGERQIRRAVRWLEENVEEASTLGLKAKLVFALVAAGKDPRSFAGHDLVEEIQASQTDSGQYGGESDTEVGYHALAMLALSAAGEAPPGNASQWLVDAQCGDGGWQFDEPSSEGDDQHCFDSSAENDFARSDTNTTAHAVMALAGAPGPEARNDPFEFLRSARDDYKGGWVYEPHGKCTEEKLGKEFCYLTDANSTALVIMAYSATGADVPDGGDRALARLQYPLCGRTMGAFAFSWDYDAERERFEKQDPNVGATVGAVPALMRFPFGSSAEVTQPPPRRRPCK
ncbi:MAG TPA: hypothetical protein VG318_16735 [Actinomycetota bacterium]|nr:hypothetical protein [Actinomycetota bacterium]